MNENELDLARLDDDGAGSSITVAPYKPSVYVCSGWACTDCLFELANGESPADMTEAEIAERDAMIDERNAGYEITLGMSRELHSCLDDDGMTAGDNGNECECETQNFSWSACDSCGSNLGGSRHAVSFFTIPE